jgi:hypothetical protein
VFYYYKGLKLEIVRNITRKSKHLETKQHTSILNQSCLRESISGGVRQREQRKTGH